MAFAWMEEQINYLRENAGKLKAREIADALGTNITAVRNMAVRLKLSLRVPGYTHEQVEAVRGLYASQGDISIREISRLTGLAHDVVSYILYTSGRKMRPQYHRGRFIEFETEEGVRLFVQAEPVDAHRTSKEALTGGQGTHYKGTNVSFAERIMSGYKMASESINVWHSNRA
ncbi:hypothetical protein AAQ05_005655 [Salmonella enterica subsp. diarizonae]|nr:hypothetical protein [Salmonella enterica subsp. diarizonae]